MFAPSSPINLGLQNQTTQDQVQTLKSASSQPRPTTNSPNAILSPLGQGTSVPQHVIGVAAIVKKTSDVSSNVTVTFQRNPNDYQFVNAGVFVSGYKGNPQPVNVASGQSPISFALENTGDPISIAVQANGATGSAPLASAPTTAAKLVKTNLATTPTTAGNGPGAGVTSITSTDGSLSVTGMTSVNITLIPFGKTNPAWWMSGDGSCYPYTNNNGAFSTGTANQVKCWYVRVPYEITIHTLSFRLIGTLVGSKSAFGVYSAAGSKLLSWDAVNTGTGASAANTTTLGAPVTLPPGIYIFACGSDTTGSSPTTQGAYTTIGSSESSQPQNGFGTVRLGTAANAMSSSAMPPTLGTISLAAVGTFLPCICLEP